MRYNRFWTIDGEPCARSDLTTITVLADDGSEPDLIQSLSRDLIENSAELKGRQGITRRSTTAIELLSF